MHTTVGLLLALAASANAYVAPGAMPLTGSRQVPRDCAEVLRLAARGAGCTSGARHSCDTTPRGNEKQKPSSAQLLPGQGRVLCRRAL